MDARGVLEHAPRRSAELAPAPVAGTSSPGRQRSRGSSGRTAAAGRAALPRRALRARRHHRVGIDVEEDLAASAAAVGVATPAERAGEREGRRGLTGTGAPGRRIGTRGRGRSGSGPRVARCIVGVFGRRRNHEPPGRRAAGPTPRSSSGRGAAGSPSTGRRSRRRCPGSSSWKPATQVDRSPSAGDVGAARAHVHGPWRRPARCALAPRQDRFRPYHGRRRTMRELVAPRVARLERAPAADATYSHCGSVGRSPPAHWQNARASSQRTHPSAWSSLSPGSGVKVQNGSSGPGPRASSAAGVRPRAPLGSGPP